MQALISGAVEAICVSPPHDLLLKRMGYTALAGPPEVGLPVAGMFTSDRLLRENPQLVKRTLKALLRAHHYILENRQDTIQILIKWLPQPLDIAEHSYDAELHISATDHITFSSISLAIHLASCAATMAASGSCLNIRTAP